MESWMFWLYYLVKFFYFGFDFRYLVDFLKDIRIVLVDLKDEKEN